jgi:hypothetical protein
MIFRDTSWVFDDNGKEQVTFRCYVFCYAVIACNQRPVLLSKTLSPFRNMGYNLEN